MVRLDSSKPKLDQMRKMLFYCGAERNEFVGFSSENGDIAQRLKFILLSFLQTMPDRHVRGLREGVSPQNHKFLSVCNPKTTSFYLHLSQTTETSQATTTIFETIQDRDTTMSNFTSFTTTTTRFSGLIVKQLQLLQQQSPLSSSVVFKEILEKPKGQICVVRAAHGNFYLWISKGGENEWKHPVRIVAVSTIKFVEAKKLASQTRSYARGMV